jgi:DNA repair protein SbcD/Mre11
MKIERQKGGKMKLAITADVHLTSYQDSPERYDALADIFEQSSSEHIDHLVVCGDLFDKNCSNYSDFEKLAFHYQNISFLILPGNHDANISSRSIVGKNIRIFEQPEIIDDALKLLFVPYIPAKTMGEIIAEQIDNFGPRNWVLFGHGDWSDGLRTLNPSEPGIYMPLTRIDIDQYLPARTFLGHIHQQLDGTVFYPGSPCGTDITETGKRRFLIYDTTANTVESKIVNTTAIFQECNITVLPVADEEAYIKHMINEVIKSWNINNLELSKIVLQVRVKGYSTNKSLLDEVLSREFRPFTFYKGIAPDTSGVYVSVDQNLIKIAETVKEKIDNLDLIQSPDEPDRDQILMQALRLIFES